jgi:DNA-binding transcriptional regulator YhcF (GntR family)
MTKKVRQKDKYLWIDCEYIDDYAAILGWKATVVYLALCRYADKNQECFPGISLLASALGISENSVKRGIAKLKRHGFIEVTEGKTTGKWNKNTYTLLAKDSWEKVLSQNKNKSTTSLQARGGYGQNAKTVISLGAQEHHSPQGATNQEATEINITLGNNEREYLEVTPGERMKIFLLSVTNQDEKYTSLVKTIASKTKIPQEIVQVELKKFAVHWTRRTIDGTKQKWEQEKTFDLSEKMISWFAHYRKFHNPKETKGIRLS